MFSNSVEQLRPFMSISVDMTLIAKVPEQTFWSGGQSDVKLPLFSSQVSLVSDHRRDEKPSRPCPTTDLNLGPVVWKRDTLQLSPWVN
ncbi:hypothetical protein TNCV_4769331 [Trichonephila clavipes]|nr:hypothetical protein TNCV_4769331 [Trichonephila clavipes]